MSSLCESNHSSGGEDECIEHSDIGCMSATRYILAERFEKIVLVLFLSKTTMKRRPHTSDMHDLLDLISMSFPFFLMSSVTSVRG